EAIGQALSTMIVPLQYRGAHQRGLKHFLATGEGPMLNKRIELTAVHRDGHEFPVELAVSPVRLGEIYTFSDIARSGVWLPSTPSRASWRSPQLLRRPARTCCRRSARALTGS